MAYILLMYLWSPSAHTLTPVSTAEFSTEERCNAAGSAASTKFGGWNVSVYYVCVQK